MNDNDDKIGRKGERERDNLLLGDMEQQMENQQVISGKKEKRKRLFEGKKNMARKKKEKQKEEEKEHGREGETGR